MAHRIAKRQASHDPTGTGSLRRKFRAAARARLARVRAQLRAAVLQHDLLGLTPDGALAPHPPSVRLAAFGHWLGLTVDQALFGRWIDGYVGAAWQKGLHDGQNEVGIAPLHPPAADHQVDLAASELKGIAAATVQNVTRAAGYAQTNRKPRHNANALLLAVFDKVAGPRMHALANTSVVGAYNAAKIESYRAAGITRVGITPETTPSKHTHDAKKKKKPRTLRLRAPPEDVDVGVLTAGDDDVCQDCQDYADGAPYEYNELELPLHPNCRCAFFPWDDLSYAGEYDAALEDERGPYKQNALTGRFEGSEAGSHSEYGTIKPLRGQAYVQRHGHEGYEFVSPNVELLELKAAQENLASTRQRSLRVASREIDKGLGIKSKDSDIIGAWRDGAENAMMSETDADWEHLRASGAMKGYLADQKQVLLFKQDDTGPAVMYKFERAGDLGDIHRSLLDDGLAFHTLAPHAGGATVYVVDTDRSLYNAVDKARHDGVEYEFGNAQFIGTGKETGADRDQRDDARRAYEKIIRESDVPNGQAVWTGVHNRWGEALSGPDGGVTGSSAAIGGGDEPTEYTDKVDALRKEAGARKLDAAQRQALDLYLYSSTEMNADARRGLDTVEGRALDAAIRQFATPRPLTVYRRVGWHNLNEALKAHVGKDFTEPGFMSTSLDPGLTFKPGSYVEIRVPKGAAALPVGSMSPHPDEAEILFPRGSRMRMVSAEPGKAPNTMKFVAELYP
ncbi:MAG: hypothetical protein C5B60_07080 [Chloroflexi bacterium]|nr:MAG: hypothetical protein C5B60_07080 [Chloroflexota bacterium]